jgi:hypothetical protein
MRNYAPLLALLPVGVLLAVLCNPGKEQSGGQKVSQLIFERGLDTKVVAPPVRAIRAGAPPPVPTASADPARQYFRAYGNYRQDSRLGRNLPSGTWHVRWKADLDPAFPPAHVIEASNRILVEAGEWRLLDRDGKLVARNRASRAPMATDSVNGLFYEINPEAYFAAYRLEDGKPAFDFLPAYGDEFSRTHLARNGNHMLIAGIQRALDPHGRETPEQSLVEIVNLGSPPTADDLGFLSTLSPVGTLRIPEPLLVVASSSDVIVAARTDEIYVIDWDLEVHAALESAFTPHAISLDEAGRIYLLADHDQRWFLMLLKQGGDRIYTFELPSGIVPSATPPIIAYDHSVYLLSPRRIYSIAPNGMQRWSATTASPLAGAAVTADDVLLTAEGNEIATYDSEAARKVLFQGDSFVTTPILTAWGEILVASKTALYCLSAR